MVFPSGTGRDLSYSAAVGLLSAIKGEVKQPHDYSHAASVFSLIGVSAVAGFCCLWSEPGAGSTYVACSSDRAAGCLYYGLDAPSDIGDTSSLTLCRRRCIFPSAIISFMVTIAVYADDFCFHNCCCS